MAATGDAASAVVANEVFASSSVPAVAAKWTPDDVASAAETAKSEADASASVARGCAGAEAVATVPTDFGCGYGYGFGCECGHGEVDRFRIDRVRYPSCWGPLQCTFS